MVAGNSSERIVGCTAQTCQCAASSKYKIRYGTYVQTMFLVASGLIVPRLPKAALPLAVGTVGALIMPHNMYLQSAVVQSR